LVLLDVMMPIMSGFKVCRQIRKQYPFHQLPIIFLTAKNQVTDLVEGFTLGANDYIDKPFQKNELLVRISKLLESNMFIEKISSINHFMNDLMKYNSIRQMFQAAFELIIENVDIDLGVLVHKGCVINEYQPTETSEVMERPTNINTEEEIRISTSQTDGHILEAQFYGFEDYQLCFKRNQIAQGFSQIDCEYIRNLVDIIKISRNSIQQLIKEPNLLHTLDKIQSLLNEVLFIEMKGSYCHVNFIDKANSLEFRISMQQLQRFFDDNILLKIHRSYIVNPSKVNRILRERKNVYSIELINGQKLPIARSLAKKVKNFLR
jgi:DNA-binding LytR/AlgR family response regulator